MEHITSALVVTTVVIMARYMAHDDFQLFLQMIVLEVYGSVLPSA